MSDTTDEPSVDQYSRIAEAVMRKQAALGIRVAAVFLVIILGLPLFNLYLPRLAAAPVLGFSFTWLLLGIGFFPVTWLLSSYFVRESDRIEAEAAAQIPGISAGRGKAVSSGAVRDVNDATAEIETEKEVR